MLKVLKGLTLEKIKISSDFRQAWKEKLEPWLHAAGNYGRGQTEVGDLVVSAIRQAPMLEHHQLSGGSGQSLYHISTLFCRSYRPARPGNNAVAPVHGLARLQVVNGVVSRGTADIDKYMMAAAVSEKKQVRGISVLA